MSSNAPLPHKHWHGILGAIHYITITFLGEVNFEASYTAIEIYSFLEIVRRTYSESLEFNLLVLHSAQHPTQAEIVPLSLNLTFERKTSLPVKHSCSRKLA